MYFLVWNFLLPLCCYQIGTVDLTGQQFASWSWRHRALVPPPADAWSSWRAQRLKARQGARFGSPRWVDITSSNDIGSLQRRSDQTEGKPPPCRCSSASYGPWLKKCNQLSPQCRKQWSWHPLSNVCGRHCWPRWRRAARPSMAFEFDGIPRAWCNQMFLVLWFWYGGLNENLGIQTQPIAIFHREHLPIYRWMEWGTAIRGAPWFGMTTWNLRVQPQHAKIRTVAAVAAKFARWSFFGYPNHWMILKIDHLWYPLVPQVLNFDPNWINRWDKKSPGLCSLVVCRGSHTNGRDIWPRRFYRSPSEKHPRPLPHLAWEVAP